MPPFVPSVPLLALSLLPGCADDLLLLFARSSEIKPVYDIMFTTAYATNLHINPQKCVITPLLTQA